METRCNKASHIVQFKQCLSHIRLRRRLQFRLQIGVNPSHVLCGSAAEAIPDAADLVTVDVVSIRTLAIALVGGQNVAAAVLYHRSALC